MDPDKKISFAFSKSAKRPSLFQKQPFYEKKVELVECLEGQSIKVKDAVVVINQPLVIPIKDNKRNLLDRIKDARAKQKATDKEKTEEVDNRPDSELTLDELAARELVKEARKRLEQKETNNKVFVLPIKEEKVAEGEIEPTLEDYDNVPISDYGLAMLRGMGWKEGLGIGKNPDKSVSLTHAPELRPKGLGLGANKMVKAEASKQPTYDKDGRELVLKRDTCAKIIAGSKKGNYCVVQGLDDEAGTVIVKTSSNSEILTLNEFLLVPVTKDEYARGSKILNAAKYEEFKVKLDKSPAKNDKSRTKDGTTSSSRSSRSNSRHSDHKPHGKEQEKCKSHEVSIKSEKKEENPTNSRKHSSQDIKKCSDSDSSSENDHDRKRRQHKKKDKRSHKDKSRSPRRSSKKSSGKHKHYSSSSPDSHYEDKKSKSKSHSSRSRKKHSRNKSK